MSDTKVTKTEKLNLKDLTLAEMEKFMAGLGEPKYRAGQVCRWVFQRGVRDFGEMTDLSLGLRQKLAEVATVSGVRILQKQVAKDGTAKYLFELQDGEAVESVLIPHDYGNSVCVSSQVGCRMGCQFCASTIGGLVRNLTAGEIYSQVQAIQEDAGQRVSSVVIMGSGEPLDNLPEVEKFIELITAPYGLNIGARHITLSTCGLTPVIRELAAKELPITLSVSLHAPNDELRDQIMPVNKKYPISELLAACREYISITKRRVTFEYALIRGFNDSREMARELGRLLHGMLCHVNLIPVNPVIERGYKKPDPAGVREFQRVLEELGVPSTVRREMGAEIDAACGQLRRKTLAQNS